MPFLDNDEVTKNKNAQNLHFYIPVLKCHQLNKLLMYELCVFDDRRVSVQQQKKTASKEREKNKRKRREEKRENESERERERKKNIVQQEKNEKKKNCIRKEVSC